MPVVRKKCIPFWKCHKSFENVHIHLANFSGLSSTYSAYHLIHWLFFHWLQFQTQPLVPLVIFPQIIVPLATVSVVMQAVNN